MVDDETEARREALARATNWGAALALASGWLRTVPDLPTPDLDAQVLLGHVTSAPRARVLAYPERTLTAEQAMRYAGLVARRAEHEPVAYLTGRREFLGLEFKSDARALIPRPETELLVEAALADLRERLTRAPDMPPRWSHACRVSTPPTFPLMRWRLRVRMRNGWAFQRV